MLGAVRTAPLARGHGGALQQVPHLLDRHGPALDVAASRAGLAHGLHLTFWGILLIAATTLALSAFVPAATLKAKMAA